MTLLHERDGTAYSLHTHTHISPTGSRPRHTLLGKKVSEMRYIYILYTYLHTHGHILTAHRASQHAARQRDEVEVTLEWAASGRRELIGRLS